ncbi:MAG: DUF350 domain-containing protein [Candidatus Thermochlorobacter aerophilum]|jgi:uncharacterized membrane protein YjfL (UPF0719 family)|uniref:DUF350 domain-containing protein n=1 Tax=Candidatus Thermochlorobacter aerophilus TaxID=1868324 RepID=A0A395LVU4_9BACT|nr:MAG: DUF350 domain-containing protein [Candidatus Thermochlorobacter aerophilum]
MAWESILFIGATLVAMLMIARLVNQFIFKASMTEVISKEDKSALGIALAGFLFGVVHITAEVLAGEGHQSWLVDAGLVALWGLGGITLLTLLSLFGFKLFHGVDYMQEVQKGNVAVGIVAAARFIATSMVIAAAVSGENTTTSSALVTEGSAALASFVFFLVGQLTLIVVTWLFRFLTSYDDAKELASGNIAAALSYSGLMIGIGIAIHKGIKGEFIGYATGLLSYAKSMSVVIAFYPIRQFLVQGLLIGGSFALYGGTLDQEISRDRNIAAGTIEAMAYISTALLITRLL